MTDTNHPSTTSESPQPVGPVEPESKSLGQALERFGIVLAPECVTTLDAYREALWHWNEKLNLTRHTTFDRFVCRDVVDSMELAKVLDRGNRLLDIGTGGGVPGLILAICRPDLRVSVCESTQKKARVVQQMVEQLQLPVTCFSCRAEEALQLQTFDTLVARAVASMAKMLTWFEPHWSAFDQLLLIKGRSWIKERAEARHRGLLRSLQLRKVVTYPMPGIDGGESVILKICRPSAAPIGG
jgi:16S rRNA (guanine527-N7)-methyltransferase